MSRRTVYPGSVVAEAALKVCDPFPVDSAGAGSALAMFTVGALRKLTTMTCSEIADALSMTTAQGQEAMWNFGNLPKGIRNRFLGDVELQSQPPAVRESA